MPFWQGKSSSHLASDPALDLPRTRQNPYQPPPSPASEGSFNPYARPPSVSGPASSSQQKLDHFSPAINVSGPSSTYSSEISEAQRYEQSTPSYDQQAANRQNVARKSIKSKWRAAAASAKEELKDDLGSHKNLFGRRKSVRKEDPRPALRQEPSLYHQSQQNAAQAQWRPEPGTLGRPQDRFEPQSPDFVLENAPTHLQTPEAYNNQAPQPPPHLHPLPYPDSPQRFGEQQSRSQPIHHQQGHFAETAPESAGSAPSPNRQSLESLPRPPSRPDASSNPNSRPSSRTSYYTGQQTAPYRPAPEQLLQESRIHAAVQEAAAAHSYRPYQPQTQQQQQQQQSGNMPPMDSNKLGPHERMGSIQQAPGPSDSGIQNFSRSSTSGLSSIPLNGRNQQAPRDGEPNQRVAPLMRARSDLVDLDVSNVTQDELPEFKKKYNRVKKEYHLQKEQITTLQNTIAHQRLSQSRTQLDDGAYKARLERLGGMISQLALSVRKDWAQIPAWLEASVNKDALQAPKEMMAVGRAVMSRWLVEEIFDKHFHPDLPSEFSVALKTVQRNLRDHAPPPQSREDEEALTAKITNWRLSTIDGIRPFMGTEKAKENFQRLAESLSEQMLNEVAQYMKSPAPSDLKGDIPMIIELAIGVLANLPQESRDVHIAYYLPGVLIRDEVMQIETNVPSFNNSAAPQEAQDTDQNSVNETASTHSGNESVSSKPEESSRKSFMSGMSGLMGNKKASKGSGSPARLPSSIQQTPVQSPLVRDDEPPKVRMCVSLGLEIRDKMVLHKAPVYRM